MSSAIPFSKRSLRWISRRLPRANLAFNLGKALTRTVLRPSRDPLPVQFEFGNGIEIQVDLGEFVGNDLYCLDEQFESTTLKLWRELARDASVIFDLGAHVGVFSLLAAATNPTASIVSVEACRRNLESLRRNTSAFDRIQVVEKAIATTRGTVRFLEDSHSGGGYIPVDDSSEPDRARGASGECYLVAAASLSDLMADLRIDHVDLIKMDLEGLERELILGQQDFWCSAAPENLIIEIRTPKRSPAILNEMLSKMHERGYISRRVQGLYALPWKEEEDLANWWFRRG